MGVFNNNPVSKKPKLRLGYGTANKARRSVKKLKKEPRQYQSQVAHTLYYRAKYHKHQTKGMKNAVKVYGKFLKTIKNKSKKRKTYKKGKINGGKFLAKGAQGYVFVPPLKCKNSINSNKYNTDGYVSKLTIKDVAETEMKIGELMKSKISNIDDYVIYPLAICEVDNIDNQRDEDKEMLKKIAPKYNTVIIMKYGGNTLDKILEDLKDSIETNRNEYKKYDSNYIKSLLKSYCNLGRFVADMNEAGYYHNDIKTANIVYNETEKLMRLIDLGNSGEARRRMRVPNKLIYDTCYFMGILFEFEHIIKYKYKIKKSIEIKYKYSNEGCYNPETEYDDFREDIDIIENYLLSEIDEKNLKEYYLI